MTTTAGGLRISPEPSDEEAAAIAAAIEVTRPVAVEAERAERESRWRFSGRWWSRPVASRRSRP